MRSLLASTSSFGPHSWLVALAVCCLSNIIDKILEAKVLQLLLNCLKRNTVRGRGEGRCGGGEGRAVQVTREWCTFTFQRSLFRWMISLPFVSCMQEGEQFSTADWQERQKYDNYCCGRVKLQKRQMINRIRSLSLRSCVAKINQSSSTLLLIFYEILSAAAVKLIIWSISEKCRQGDNCNLA